MRFDYLKRRYAYNNKGTMETLKKKKKILNGSEMNVVQIKR